MPDVPPLQFSEPELQLLLMVLEHSRYLDDGGDLLELTDKVHEHYIAYLTSTIHDTGSSVPALPQLHNSREAGDRR